MNAPPFPWADVIEIGLGVMRLAPSSFWALTPREFAVLAKGRGLGRQNRPGRADLDELIRMFPDRNEPHDGK